MEKENRNARRLERMKKKIQKAGVAGDDSEDIPGLSDLDSNQG